MDLTVRYADIKDCAALGRVQSESWRAAYKGLVNDSVLDSMSPENCARKFEELFSQSQGECALMTLQDETIGFICFGGNRDEDLDNSYGEIWGIYLLPSFQGRGLGKEFLDWGISELQKRGFSNASLWVLEGNTQARRFYEKSGFVRDGAVKALPFDSALYVCRYVKAIS